MYPKICVLLSTYNGKNYLEEQLDSIFMQQMVDVDILIRDDGSTDGTQDILDKWQENGRIKWYQGENCGPAHSFMKLIAEVSDQYSYFAFADQDDKWKPEKLKKAIECIKDYEKECLYHSKTTLVDCNLKTIHSPFKETQEIQSFGASMVATKATGCTMVWNRKLMKRLKAYSPNYLIMHDNWVYIVCRAFNGQVIYDRHSYILYRQHEDNVIGNIRKQQFSRWQLLVYRIKKFFNVTNSNSLIAKELVNGYRDVLPVENCELAEILASANDKVINRFEVALNPQFRIGYWAVDCQFCWKAIIGKL